MNISCLTITQLTRIHLLPRCLQSFREQTLPSAARELVLVHHDGAEATRAFTEILEVFQIKATIVSVEHAPLGTLRNISIEHAAGDLLCQWDDDDFYHPDRLLLQSAPFADDDCVASSLDSQLFWFCESGDLYIRRGSREGIHGTVMFRRELGLRYSPAMSRGEDSRFMQEVLGRGRVHRVDHHPELYVRRYHGRNTWEFDHHYKQALRSFDVKWLREKEPAIRNWLKALNISGVRVRAAHEIAFTVGGSDA